MKLQNKKIAFFIAETIPSYAGSGRNAFNLAEYLITKNNSCRIIAYNYNHQLTRKEFVNGVFIRRIPYFNKNIFSKLLSVPILIFNYFLQVLWSETIFIYGSYLIGYGWIIFFSKLLHRKLVFQSTLLKSDDIASIKRQSTLLWFFRKYLFNKINCYWAINEKFLTIWQETIKSKVPVAIIPQGINLNVFYRKKIKATKAADKKSLKILSCGFLINRKGYQDVFYALSKLNIPFHYTVLGQYLPDIAHRSSTTEVQEMKTLYKLGTSLLRDKIEFIGTTDNIVEYLHNSDVLIHGAIQEGTPNIILEAMASGTLLICRQLEGLTEQLLKPESNCMTFSDQNSLSNLIIKMYKDELDLKDLTENAYATISKNYSFEKVISQIEQCLD